ncbi:MAG: hypothetical protein WBH45_06575 [Acidobacteriaceae bacterium]|jgi:hypothetical protein
MGFVVIGAGFAEIGQRRENVPFAAPVLRQVARTLFPFDKSGNDSNPVSNAQQIDPLCEIHLPFHRHPSQYTGKLNPLRDSPCPHPARGRVAAKM